MTLLQEVYFLDLEGDRTDWKLAKFWKHRQVRTEISDGSDARRQRKLLQGHFTTRACDRGLRAGF